MEIYRNNKLIGFSNFVFDHSNERMVVKNYTKFDVKIQIPGKRTIIKNIIIPLLGLHNIKNATSALSVAFSIGVPSKIIKQAINQLTDKFKTVILLRDIQELSYEDISSIVGVPIGTIKSRINRARLQLQIELKHLRT